MIAPAPASSDVAAKLKLLFKSKVAPAEMLKSPVVLPVSPPTNCKVPVCTFTVPVLLKAMPLLMTNVPVPMSRVKMPLLLKVPVPPLWKSA